VKIYTEVIWVITPFSPVSIYQRFEGTCCLHSEHSNEHSWDVDKFYRKGGAIQQRMNKRIGCSVTERKRIMKRYPAVK
jgi:hypothetical protein